MKPKHCGGPDLYLPLIKDSYMTILEDIRREQGEIDASAREVANYLTEQARSKVGYGEKVRPIVAALVDGQTELFFPTWSNDYDRHKVFTDLNTQLDEKPVDATVIAYGATYIERAIDPQEVRDHPESLSAVIVTIRTGSLQEMVIHPYRETEDAVLWVNPVIVDSFTNSLIHQPCVD